MTFAALLLGFVALLPPPAGAEAGGRGNQGYWIKVTSGRSLTNLESIDSFGVTEQGTLAAKLLLRFLTSGDRQALMTARSIYSGIIPKENFGGDYTALQWFSDLFLAEESERATMLKDPLVASYYKMFAANQFTLLKEYLGRKYMLGAYSDLDTEKGRIRLAFLEDSILFNNPRREVWEQTKLIIDSMELRPGETIADIGSGPGYYSFRFAERVGPGGKIYAIDTVKEHLTYIEKVKKAAGVSNIITINNHNESIGLEAQPKVDTAFMCSLYHIIYVVFRESARQELIENIKGSLKPDGRLVIVDNSLVHDSQLPYHGPYIAKELVIAQLEHYGFRLESTRQFIPQRYVLTFRLK
ncbi:methyltransferase domain-containing protein [Cyanobium gracile UHCC 0139]|uniref:Methyltransferase domain-containing protein n=1 Tax=Cyanobium gracile UHCC 0139 TaxID=3110308 RepID=A0ABU5RRE8_9CYAN|nr:methyltransferase domain-containing protein [Cyanobium gracile]MEA5390333.1 methyltransferase domain-containing protein [Cyanobium gracile UHCC 0139]